MSRSRTIRYRGGVVEPDGAARSNSGRIDLRRLRYFVTVAEERHFGRAAARLHLSTPPLSQRVRELEVELGLTLFERTSRRVELTEAGERLLGEARAVLRAADRFEHVARELAAPGGNTMVFGYCTGSEGGALRAVRSFQQQLPGFAVRPEATTSLRAFDGLRTGRVAVAIVRGPVPSPELLASVPLTTVPIDHVALPPDHPMAQREGPVRAAELSGQLVLVVERSEAPAHHDAIMAYCAALDVRPRWVVHPATQVERVLDMVAVGTGIGWLNAWQAERESGRADVVIKPLVPLGMHDAYRVAWRAGDAHPATASFVRVVLETCGA